MVEQFFFELLAFFQCFHNKFITPGFLIRFMLLRRLVESRFLENGYHIF